MTAPFYDNCSNAEDHVKHAPVADATDICTVQHTTWERCDLNKNAVCTEDGDTGECFGCVSCHDCDCGWMFLCDSHTHVLDVVE